MIETLEALEAIKIHADNYRHTAQESLIRNTHMNELVEGEFILQRYIDAVLVDFINYIGVKHGVDYALYTDNLK